MKFQKMFAALALSFAVIACSKEQAAPEEEATKPQEPQTEQTDVPEGYVRLTFSTPAETKTSVEGNVVSWSEHDRIKICWDGGNATSDEVVISEGIARFTANVSAAAEDLYAVYPDGITASVASGTLNVDIPQSQTGRFADADIIVAKTTKTELTYAFHHAVSLVRFVISDGNTRGITRARFVDKGHSSQLYGTLGITFDASNAIATNDLVGNPDNDIIDITAVQEGDNFIAVPPTKSLAGYGLRMGTSSAWLPGIVGEKDYAFADAGGRLALGTVDTKINDGNWYVTPDGAGTKDGKSWENAGDASMLWNLIHLFSDAGTGKKNLARGWRIDGKTIYVSEGVYDSPLEYGFVCSFEAFEDDDDNIATFKIEGGYTTAGVASSSAKTIFGATDPDDPMPKRAFRFYGGTDVTLKNLYLSNHTYKDGGAVSLIHGAVVQFDGCTFENNTTSTNGGAINAADNGNTIILNDCIFKGNKAADGGAIYLKSTDSEEGIQANHCKFLGNSASGANASGVFSCGKKGKATFFFNACEFRNNTTSAGGSICFIRAQDKIGFNNCLFLSNTSTVAFRILSYGNIVIANSSIFEYRASNAGYSLDANNSNANIVLVNNIICRNDEEAGTDTATMSARFGTAGTKSTSFNIYGGTSTYWSSDVTGVTLSQLNGSAKTYDTHLAGTTAGVTSGMSYYEWDGTNPTGFSKATKTDVSTAIGNHSGIGSAFLSWLNELHALDEDIRGNSRGTGEIWPGSYQN